MSWYREYRNEWKEIIETVARECKRAEIWFSCLNKTGLTDLSAQIRYSGRIFFVTDILEEDSLWIKKRM